MKTERARKTKYLVETSAVRAAIGSSTRAHQEAFAKLSGDGTLFSSVYIRMEFMRRWVCDTIRAALVVDQCGSVKEALVHLEQDFRPRTVKTYLAALSEHLNQHGSVENTRAAAEEIARTATHWLRKFDRVFEARIGNACKCRI